MTDPFTYSLFSAQVLSFTEFLWTPTKGVEYSYSWELLLTELANKKYFKWYYECIAMSLYIVLWKTEPARTWINVKLFSLSPNDAQDGRAGMLGSIFYGSDLNWTQCSGKISHPGRQITLLGIYLKVTIKQI